MPCTPKKTVAQIVASENHYCIVLKGNQKTLLKTAKHCTQTQVPLSTFQESDLSHGRQVERTIRVFAAPRELQSQWASLSAFVAVNRQGFREGKPFNSDSWYLLSQIIPASQAAGLIRNHRATVENQLHWVKDVIQGEDDSQIRGAQPATLMAFLRTWALTAFRQAGFKSLTKAIRLFSHNLPKLISFL